MGNARLAALPAAALLAASLAFAFAARGVAAQPASLGQDARHTLAAGSLRFELTAENRQAAAPPYVLHASGAAAYLHVKVADLYTPNGSVLAGPFADEETDGSFLYFRSTVTRGSVGSMWVRERMATTRPNAPEVRMLHQLAPSALLAVLGRAQDVRASDGGRVLHASVPYGDPVVRAALAGVEGGVEYRNLRLTAWVGAQGYVRLLVLTGRTPDESSTFLLTLALHGYGRSVTVTPPAQGSFVDFTLGRLSM